MNGNPDAMHPIALRLDEVNIVRGILHCLADAQSRVTAVRMNLQAALELITGNLNGQERLFMLRNKWGLSKQDAKKLYNDIHTKGSKEEEEEGNHNPQTPDSMEKKISMIMDYMKETSAKLDSIDRDIDHLKRQVEEILRRI